MAIDPRFAIGEDRVLSTTLRSIETLYAVAEELRDRPLLKRIVKDVAFDLDNAEVVNPVRDFGPGSEAR